MPSTSNTRRWAAFAAIFGVALNATPSATAYRPLRERLVPSMCGRAGADRIALSFDDGPDPQATPLFLELLDRFGWKATFFVLGENVRSNPAIARQIVARGHEIALHGDTHDAHIWRTPRAVARDLRRGLDAIVDATGQRPTLFRPPHGYLSAGSLYGARKLGVRPVLWTTWGREWRPGATPAQVADQVRRDLRAGGTVLLHDSDCTAPGGTWRAALGALELLAADVEAHGWRVVTVGEHLELGA